MISAREAVVTGCAWSADTGVMRLRCEEAAAASAHGYGREVSLPADPSTPSQLSDSFHIETRKFNGMCSYPTERDPYERKMVECR